MKQVIIEHSIINSPIEEPIRHFRVSEDGMTDQTETDRRPSCLFVPMPKSEKNGRRSITETE